MIKKILKQNLKYMLLVLVIWGILFPLIIINRDQILVWYSLKVSRQHYNESSMNGFLKKGNSILHNSNANLELMRDACDYYKNLNHVDPILYEPKWYDQAHRWQNPKDKESSWFGSFFGNESQNSKQQEPLLKYYVHPRDYWNGKEGDVLEALDYYKRALNYAGPNFEPVKKIEEVGWAVCRPREVVLAYSTFILNTEEYVEEKLAISYPNDSEIIKTYRIISAIKNGKFKEARRDFYEKGLIYLLLELKWANISPTEAENLYTKLIVITSNQKEVYNRFRKKRGLLRYKLGQEKKDNYKLAIEDFLAAREYPNMDEFKTKELNVYLNDIFESDLMIIKCYIELNQIEDAQKTLSVANSDIQKIFEEGGILEASLQEDYKEIRRIILRKLGRTREADEIR
ncbi:MAG: hypothetical protein H7A23_13585 [Leptospiraceae bacterium]|nr:hypothetical protein [Leptospiraceae bacterium]